jgi:TolB-like protein/Flp pilus assembly protein TadD
VATQQTTASVGAIPSDRIREQLDRILKSKTFQTVERLKRFLAFVVTETIEGRGDQLKEFVVGMQVFNKEPTFDPRNDPIVRVQARRLRTRLARYYLEEGQSDEILIDLPKGGYAVTLQGREPPSARRLVATSLVSRNTVAVLAFSDYSPAADLGYFCRGLADEIIDQLAKSGNARVIAWDALHGSPSPDSLPAPSRMNVATVISGSVRRSRDDLRITAQIIDGASGCYAWSESFDRKIEAGFAVQQEIAKAVLNRLQEGASSLGMRAKRAPTDNLAAYNLYLQGRYHLSQRTEETLRKAVDFFEKVISEDPHYAEAYSGLADAYSLLAHYGGVAPAEVWAKAAANAAWAVLQDDSSAEAHTSLAHVKATQDWDWKAAESEYQRAVHLDSRYPTAHHWYGISCLAPMGRLDEALEQMQLAQALDPISSIIARDLAVIHYYRRDFETALEQCDATIELNPHFPPAYLTLGLIQEQMEDFDESAAALQRGIQLSPQSPRMQAALARILARQGRVEEASVRLEQLHDLAEKRYVSPFEIASTHFALGLEDQGFDWLKRAFQDRCFELVSLKVDPRFDAIKSDTRFKALAARLGLD